MVDVNRESPNRIANPKRETRHGMAKPKLDTQNRNAILNWEIGTGK